MDAYVQVALREPYVRRIMTLNILVPSLPNRARTQRFSRFFFLLLCSRHKPCHLRQFFMPSHCYQQSYGFQSGSLA